MTTLGSEVVALLRQRGPADGRGVRWLLSARPDSAEELPADHPAVNLLTPRGTTTLIATDAVQMFDVALATLAALPGHREWCATWLSTAWSPDAHRARTALSELEAFGTLVDGFPTCLPQRPRKRAPTADFLVPGEVSVEVYCPREATTAKKAVAEQFAKQTGPVKIAMSHPHTGDGDLSRRFPANAVADRLLNAKRDSRQSHPGLPSILYVDVRHEWALSTDDLLPFRTLFSKDVHWIGTHGSWHAFYGDTGQRTMLGERTALRFMTGRDGHEQMRRGLFRECRDWSAALLAVRDGLILFENPWATIPLSDDTCRRVLRLDRLRVEYSWLRAGATPSALEQQVESMLARMTWIFNPRTDE